MPSTAAEMRRIVSQSFLSAPLLIAGWALFMGVAQGNIGLLVLALGQATVVPLAATLQNLVLEFVLKKLGISDSWFTTQNHDVCNIIPSKMAHGVPYLWAAPSFWIAQIAFFFGFLISSATHIIAMEADEGANEEKVAKRKTQGIVVLSLGIVLFLVMIAIRKVFVGCETYAGLLLGAGTMSALGAGWYELARACSARDADIFGIVQKILPAAARDEPPMTCVYTGK